MAHVGSGLHVLRGPAGAMAELLIVVAVGAPFDLQPEDFRAGDQGAMVNLDLLNFSLF